MVLPRATLRVRVNKKIYVRSARVVLPEFAKGRKLNGVGGQKGRRANHGKAGEGHGEEGWRGEVAGRGSTRTDNVQLEGDGMPLAPMHTEAEAESDSDGDFEDDGGRVASDGGGEPGGAKRCGGADTPKGKHIT